MPGVPIHAIRISKLCYKRRNHHGGGDFMLGRAILIMALGLTASATGPAFGQAPGPSKSDAIVHALTPAGSLGTETRGIRIAKPGQQPSVSLNVEFASGSAVLTPPAMRDLDSLGQALGDQRLAAFRFRVEGHTDTVGARGYNKALSERRAQSVESYLVSKYHIDPARLTAVGMGEDGLAVPTPDQTSDTRNRRVLVVNVGS
jgi:outer membrane protein OmpA-like peptidoglycan-associated protein